MLRVLLSVLVATFVLGCSTDGGQATDGGEKAGNTGEKRWTVDVSADLATMLEHSKVRGACKQYYADMDGASDELRLLCGKEMFFYEPFGTAAIPRSIVEFMGAKLPKSLGVGYSGIGMIDDPNDDNGLPIGLAAGVTIASPETATKVGFTCAACHFGKTADGRFAAGQANHDYDYGKFILALSLFANKALGLPTETAPEADKEIQPLLDEFAADPQLKTDLLTALQPLIAEAQKNPPPTLTVAQQKDYAKWKPGTQDFLMTPVGPDDQVHVVTKIISLWNIPTEDGAKKAGMPHAMLAWTGGAQTLQQFVRGFIAIAYGAQDTWTDKQLQPLVDYIRTLQAPTPLQPSGTASDVAKGKKVFADAGCVDCHGGPAGSGTRVYTFDEMGTDAALKLWDDKDQDGKSDTFVGSDVGEGPPYTHGVKSPRLAGAWSQKLFLHNGSVDSLEALLCVDVQRPTVKEPVYGDGGHLHGCDLSASDKSALLAYLRAF